MKDYRELKVWHAAHALTLKSYRLTRSFPREELYGLTSQIRRCAASVAANIAEGCGRMGNAELNRFLQIASGSASELEYHYLLARDLGMVTEKDHTIVAAEIIHMRKMLSALITKIAADVAAPKVKSAVPSI
jgi:four helix bundle protein